MAILRRPTITVVDDNSVATVPPVNLCNVLGIVDLVWHAVTRGAHYAFCRGYNVHPKVHLSKRAQGEICPFVSVIAKRRAAIV